MTWGPFQETYKASKYPVVAEGTNMTRVRVQKIESIRDPEGNLGKRIELIEDRVIPMFAVRPATEEARMVQEVVKTLQQQLPMLTKQTQFALPKMILFLTEREYEKLGIDFDVNQIYELDLSGQAIRFKRAP
ncbi:MAG: arcadin 1 [Candidatus Bathyarchaeota archaeon]|nr:arcadin 1 [Candidatus Bathyarchaeota archaeon]